MESAADLGSPGAERRVYLTAAMATVVLDLITKVIAEATLLRTPGISIIGDWFQLRLVYNQGAAFGLARGAVFPMDLLYRRAARRDRSHPHVAKRSRGRSVPAIGAGTRGGWRGRQPSRPDSQRARGH